MRNKNESKFLKLFSLLVIMISFIISCGKNYDEDIIGKWKDKHGTQIEFTETGTVKNLARNVDKDFVDGSYKIKDDSLLIEFMVVPEPNSINGNLDFLILKLDSDSLVLNTGLGSLNYERIKRN